LVTFAVVPGGQAAWRRSLRLAYRPVSAEYRLGAQMAVETWKRSKRAPSSAMRSMFGVGTAPP
jgi:hypothetical protein